MFEFVRHCCVAKKNRVSPQRLRFFFLLLQLAVAVQPRDQRQRRIRTLLIHRNLPNMRLAAALLSLSQQKKLLKQSFKSCLLSPDTPMHCRDSPRPRFTPAFTFQWYLSLDVRVCLRSGNDWLHKPWSPG